MQHTLEVIERSVTEKIKSLRSADEKARYVLWTDGDNPLICFGINPGDPAKEKSGNTIKALSEKAQREKFDSWIMLNVYPQCEPNVNNLHLESCEVLKEVNLKQISKVLNEVKGRSSQPLTIWAAWGATMGDKKRRYLQETLRDMVVDLKLDDEKEYRWVSCGERTKYKHPRHPARVCGACALETFNISEYISELELE